MARPQGLPLEILELLFTLDLPYPNLTTIQSYVLNALRLLQAVRTTLSRIFLSLGFLGLVALGFFSWRT